MSLWSILFLCLTACADSPGGDGPAPGSQGTPRLSLSDILHGAERAGVASRLEVAGHETVCVRAPDVWPLLPGGDDFKDACFWSLVGGRARFHDLLVESLSEIVLDNQCDQGVSGFVFSRPEGRISTYYIPGHKHLVFYGPDYGWMLMPVSDEAADHVLSGRFCEAGE